MKTGVQLIAEERMRQQVQFSIGEGRTREDDADHTHGELALAARCYATPGLKADSTPSMTEWPWGEQWWKPKDDPIRNLVRAGALIAAEIDRLQAIEKP